MDKEKIVSLKRYVDSHYNSLGLTFYLQVQDMKIKIT